MWEKIMAARYNVTPQFISFFLIWCRCVTLLDTYLVNTHSKCAGHIYAWTLKNLNVQCRVMDKSLLNEDNLINVRSCTELLVTLPYRSSPQHSLASCLYHPSLAFIRWIFVKQNSYLWSFLMHSDCWNATLTSISYQCNKCAAAICTVHVEQHGVNWIWFDKK